MSFKCSTEQKLDLSRIL